MATPKQIKLIQTLRGKLMLTREEYLCLLSSYGVESSKNLNDNDAGHLLNMLIDMGVTAKVWVNRNSRQPRQKKYDDLRGRDPDMATPRQLRMIEAMWAEVSRATDEEGREKALRVFLGRFKVSDIRFVDKRTASKIITALENMAASKEKQHAA